MKIFLAVCILATTASALLAEPEIKGTPKELAAWLDGVAKPVTFSGEAEIKAPADQATVRLIVHTESKGLEDALRKNQEIRGKIVAELKKNGIPADAVEVSKFSSTPKFGFFGDKAKSYTVENFVTIRVQKESEFQSVAAIVDAWPEVRYDGIQFEQTAKEAFKLKALKQACDRALEKKALFEQALGVRLRPRTFSESATQTPVSATPRKDLELISGLSSASFSRTPVEAGPASFGEVIFKASVTVEFIVDK